MAQCEKCASTFTPSTDRTEVTSLRVLCPPCEAERRAEKAARAKAATAAQATARPAAAVTKPPATQASTLSAAPATGLSGAGATGIPGSQPKPAVANPKPPAAEDVPAAPKPKAGENSRHARAAAPGARRPADVKRKTVGTGVSGAKAKALHGAPSKKLYHKPVKDADTEHAVENFHPDVKREIQFLQQREGKVMKIAWIVCAVLVLAAGGFALAAKTKRDNDAKKAAEAQARIDDFRDAMLKFEAGTEKGANEALAFYEANKEIPWEDDPKAGPAVGGVLTKARMSLQRISDEKDQHARLAAVETAIANPSAQTAENLRKQRRTIESLEGKGDTLGKDFEDRVKAARAKIDQTILARLFEEASAAAKASGGGAEQMRAALNAYSAAENEATALLDRVMRQKDEATKQFYTKEFQRIVEESNAFMIATFTPEMIERTPWTDLLASDQEKLWQNYGLTGWRLQGGVMEVAGPAAGSTAHGLIAVPNAGGYRDFVLEMEFVLNQGIVDWLFRLGRRVDNTVEYYTTSTTGENPLKPGVTYTLTASYIGNKLAVSVAPADSPEFAIDSNWTKNRKGAFGGQIHEGVDLKITKLRIRDLRGA